MKLIILLLLMIPTNNKEVVQHLYAEVLNNRNMELLKDLVSDEYTGINGEKGAIAFQHAISPLLDAFPDAHWTIEEIIAEGNKVVVRQQLTGTHMHPFQQIAATGKHITNNGIAIYELKDGKIIHSSIQTDRLSFLQDLNMVRLKSPAQISFIDKFIIPAAAFNEFNERMRANRKFISTLPGFISDEAYTSADKDGNVVCITVALWADMAAFTKAKEAVGEEYKKQGFDPVALFKRLHILAERGVYAISL
jgi:steroid delta-isomerase-like uncharacterized protein